MNKLKVLKKVGKLGSESGTYSTASQLAIDSTNEPNHLTIAT